MLLLCLCVFRKRIRGKGLSYSYGIRVDLDQGALYFNLFKSTNLVGAYEECHTIINEYSILSIL